MKKAEEKTRAPIKIPAPVLVLLHIAVAFLLAWLIPLPWAVPPVIQTAGFLLVILGFLLGIGAMIAFRLAYTTLNPHGSAARLVTLGVFRFTRNPVYLGFLLMLIGLPLNAGSYWGLALAPIMIFLFNRLIIEPEEENLRHKFGEEYRSYSAKAKRWL